MLHHPLHSLARLLRHQGVATRHTESVRCVCDISSTVCAVLGWSTWHPVRYPIHFLRRRRRRRRCHQSKLGMDFARMLGRRRRRCHQFQLGMDFARMLERLGLVWRSQLSFTLKLQQLRLRQWMRRLLRQRRRHLRLLGFLFRHLPKEERPGVVGTKIHTSLAVMHVIGLKAL